MTTHDILSLGHEIKDSGNVDTSGDLRELMRRKDDLEQELESLIAVLESNNCDMETRLVTPDGFPRSDIDVAQITTVRTTIIRKRNDLRALMGALDIRLQEHFAAGPTEAAAASETAGLTRRLASTGISEYKPFAIIVRVVENSPAFDAGLQAGDLLLKFGRVHAANHNNLTRLADFARQNENNQIEVFIERRSSGETTRVTLNVTPHRNWDGPGILGFQLQKH